jgi:hypothetical protein
MDRLVVDRSDPLHLDAVPMRLALGGDLADSVLEALLLSTADETFQGVARKVRDTEDTALIAALLARLDDPDRAVVLAALRALKRVAPLDTVAALQPLTRGLQAQGVPTAAREAIAAIQRRDGTPLPGALTVAPEPQPTSGELSVAPDPSGHLSIPDPEGG